MGENTRLKEENERLISEITLLNSKANLGLNQSYKVNGQRLEIQSSNNFMNNDQIIDKIKLFRSIFNGREDVYAVRLEKNGQATYSPSRYIERQYHAMNHKYIPLSDKVIYDHLAGNQTIGLYPLRLDQKCAFLVIDFDKDGWKQDISFLMELCKSLQLPAYIERSRSGNGGHIWFFFKNPILAKTARELGNSLIKQAKAINPGYQIKSFDRMFPNQDIIPKGGFGNLIALPLQKQPLKVGNSAFVDHNFNAYIDQWSFLKLIKKIDETEVVKVINQIKEIEINRSKFQLKSKDKEKNTLGISDIPSFLEITYSNRITIEKNQLTPKFSSLLYNMSSFNNPEIYRKEALRKSTYNTPRVISLYNDYGSTIQLPRGNFEQLCEVADTYNIPYKINYNWFEGKSIEVGFKGQLKAKQEKVVEELLKKPTGILSATTGFGKTVIAAALIGKLKTNTLIILNKRSILNQWIQQLKTFLDIDSRNIGQYSGLSKKRTGIIDVALIQSLNYKGNIPELMDEYGLVLVDECHHASSIRYEQLLSQIKSKYVYGLTATLIRKDGQHPIV